MIGSQDEPVDAIVRPLRVVTVTRMSLMCLALPE